MPQDTHARTHALSRTDSSGLWLCPCHPGQSVRWHRDGAGEKGERNRDGERRNVRMRGTKGQEDKNDNTLSEREVNVVQL